MNGLIKNKIKVIVIGAGASGLMAAGFAAKKGADVCIIEREKVIGKKLLITGKGRCNVTNNSNISTVINSIPNNNKFLYSALNNFTPQDVMSFFEEHGVELKTERGNRVFPKSDKSSDIVKALLNFIKKYSVKILNYRAKEIILNNNKKIIGIKTFENKFIEADSVIIASGGKSYPKTGSTGDGYIMAKNLGHTVTKLRPSLVPLISKQKWCTDLQGLSLKNIEIRVLNKENNKIIYKDFGEMIFTHFGLSGPVILSASSHMKNINENKYSIIIDLKPALTEKQLDLRILKDFNKNLHKDLSNSLNDLLPKKMIPVIIKLSNIDPHVKCEQITKEQRRNLIKLLKNLVLDIKKFRPIEEAIITSGGIKVNEINSSTMESKLIKNLYFVGEIIDVDAYTGGFNLQIAFSTGKLAGENSVKEGD